MSAGRNLFALWLTVAPLADVAHAQKQIPSAAQEAATRARAQAALKLDPRQLPRAPKDRFARWGPREPLLASVAEPIGAGMRAYAAQDYPMALAYFHAALNLEAEYPPALYQAGLCYFRLRRYSDAAELLERFAKVVPHEIGATQALGHCYYTLGDYPRAILHYGRVLAANPGSPEALRGLALTHMRSGDNRKALELLDRVLELRPDHADALAWRAQILFEEGDAEAARAPAERARDLEPWEPRPWFLLSRILSELGEDTAAEAARTRFEVASRVDQQARMVEGELLHEPGRLDLWARLGALSRSVDNRAAARSAFERLALLGARDRASLRAAADGFEWLGQHDRCVELAQRLEKAAGQDRETWSWLADFYRRRKDLAAADRAQRALDGIH